MSVTLAKMVQVCSSNAVTVGLLQALDMFMLSRMLSLSLLVSVAERRAMCCLLTLLLTAAQKPLLQGCRCWLMLRPLSPSLCCALFLQMSSLPSSLLGLATCSSCRLDHPAVCVL